ncbi:MAG: glycosyltransferase, partial [Puniceicoccaceae bacterium]
MKIWILTSETPHHWAGGIARYVDNFARAAGREGHTLTVISRGEKAGVKEVSEGYRLVEFVHRYEASRHPIADIEPDEHPGWPFNNMCYFAALSYQYVWEIERLLKEEGPPDIIECQDYAALGYFLLQKKLTDESFLRETPVVVHLHTPDFAVQQFNQYPRYKLPDYWIGRMERAAIWMADALLSPSHFIPREIQDFVEGDLPKVTTIPYPWPELQQATEVGPGQRDLLVCPGRIELRKGVEPLLAACENLWLGGAVFTLEMVGGDVHTPLKGGSLTTFLKKKYAHRIETGNLVFTGALPHADCVQKMSQAAAIVIPSLWENFPNTCIEAMSLGKVVVASEQGGQAEMVGPDGTCGLTFSHHEQGSLEKTLLKALAMKGPERESMGHAAAERIESLCSLSSVLPARLQHFKEVVEAYQPKEAYPFVNRALRESKPVTPLQDDPLISVVVPYYNLGKYVQECIDSIYASAGARFEVVIVNDGSNDPQSLEALETIRQGDYAGLRILD